MTGEGCERDLSKNRAPLMAWNFRTLTLRGMWEWPFKKRGAAVAGRNDRALRVQLETIALVAERYEVSSVARIARRRLDGR